MPSKRTDIQKGLTYLQLMQYVLFGAAILYFGRSLFVPLCFALLISFILYPVCKWLEKKGVSRFFAIFIALSIMFIIALLIVSILIGQIMVFMDEWPALQAKLDEGMEEISMTLIEVFNISKEEQERILEQISGGSGTDIITIVKNTISASAVSIIFIVLVPVYAFLILFYRRYWMKVLYRVFPGEKNTDLKDMVTSTVTTYYNFIKGMAIVYLAVGTLNSIGLLILGVPHAFLFGFIASILTFIPYVGIIVGSLLPITISWITYDSIWYPIGVIGIFTFVQYLEANVIFPLAVSNRLQVNMLVMLLAIFAGGLVWGVAGMILFVPFVGIAKLVADHHPKWKTASMILGGEKGK